MDSHPARPPMATTAPKPPIAAKFLKFRISNPFRGSLAGRKRFAMGYFTAVFVWLCLCLCLCLVLVLELDLCDEFDGRMSENEDEDENENEDEDREEEAEAEAEGIASIDFCTATTLA